MRKTYFSMIPNQNDLPNDTKFGPNHTEISVGKADFIHPLIYDMYTNFQFQLRMQ